MYVHDTLNSINGKLLKGLAQDLSYSDSLREHSERNVFAKASWRKSF